MSEKRDFFVSFTGADTEIATALNDALTKAGFSTWFHPKDKPKGAGIADWMEVALDASLQMIAICSPTYFDRAKGYSRAERQSMFWEDPTNNIPLLILVKVEEVTFPRLIAQNEYISLVGLQAPEAAQKLLSELQGEHARLARIEVEGHANDRRPPAVFNVPGGPSALFTGRETEMAMLHDRLRNNTATAITAVAGAGGIGKSTLAREYAHRRGLATRYGGVWWIPAENENSILSAYERLAEHPSTDVTKDAEQSKTAENVRDWLARQPASKPWLVIFDNAPDDESIARLLPQGTARVLITSRFLDFDPSVAETMPLDYWDDETTATHLVERAGRGNEAEALALAKRLGGLPLAAEQAGAYLAARPSVSFAAYEAMLVERLKDNPKKLPAAYPGSVWATTVAAVDAVLEREEGGAALGILTLCAFLSPDGVELQLLQAAAQTGDTLPDPPRAALTDDRVHEALRALTGYSLLRVVEDPEEGPVLILHRLLAEVVRARLQSTEVKAWSEAVVLMIRAVMPHNTKDDPSCWQQCARLLPHVRALQGLEPGPGKVGRALGYVLNHASGYLIAKGDFDGSVALLRRCITLTERAFGSNSQQSASALSNLAGLLQDREETWDEAEAAYERVLEIERELASVDLASDDTSIAITLSNWGGLDWRRKHFAKAVERMGQAAEVWKAAYGVNSTQYASGLNNLGTVYSDWARETDNAELRAKARAAKEQASQITLVLRGPRHPEMSGRFQNLSVMFFDDNDIPSAAMNTERALAVDLSLGLSAHPKTQRRIADLQYAWNCTGQADKAARLAAGDFSDLIPMIALIEDEHRAWVAEDPDNRHFGPPSRFT